MHSNRRSFLGLTLAAAAMAVLATPAMTTRAGADVLKGGHTTMVVMYDHAHVPHVIGYYNAGSEDIAFVDGKLVVPGGEQLRLFYRNLYRPFGQYAAMQPDNGAGQVSGDRAQSVGKAGDLKAGLPGKVKSETPSGKAVDARRTSWLHWLLPRNLRPVPS